MCFGVRTQRLYPHLVGWVMATHCIVLSSPNAAVLPTPGWVGNGQVMFVRLHNPREIAAEWVLKKPMDAGADKDWLYFKVDPSQGSLPARSSQLLKARPSLLAFVFCAALLFFSTKGGQRASFAKTFPPGVLYTPDRGLGGSFEKRGIGVYAEGAYRIRRIPGLVAGSASARDASVS